MHLLNCWILLWQFLKKQKVEIFSLHLTIAAVFFWKTFLYLLKSQTFLFSLTLCTEVQEELFTQYILEKYL